MQDYFKLMVCNLGHIVQVETYRYIVVISVNSCCSVGQALDITGNAKSVCPVVTNQESRIQGPMKLWTRRNFLFS